MGWSLGFDQRWRRDIGYGVPAYCDHPECQTVIDRGLSHVCCGAQPYGGDEGCGLYFCAHHHDTLGRCERCSAHREPFNAKPEHPDWLYFKETDASWAEWRAERDALAKGE